MSAMPIAAPALVALLTLAASPFGLGQKKFFTVEDLYHPDQQVDFEGPQFPRLRWMANGTHYLQFRGQERVLKVDARSGRSEPLFSLAGLEGAFNERPDFGPEAARQASREGRLDPSPNGDGVLISFRDDLYYYSLPTGPLVRLTHDPAVEEEAELSPSARLVAFVRNNELHVASTLEGSERRLTFDGDTDLRNGVLDWVYQEEIYGRGGFKGYWWSPDSSRIAFLQLDDSRVPRFTVVDHRPVHLDLEVAPYPKAGDPNPSVRLGILSVESGRRTWADLSLYERQEILVVNVSWSRKRQRVFCQVQNREQTWLDLLEVDPDSGTTRKLFRETSTAWVNRLDSPHELEDGSFLWQSERSGYRHLYHFSAEGEFLSTLTSGEWDVLELEAVDEDAGQVFFTARQDRGLENHLYRVPLEGGAVTRLTGESGSHSIQFSPANDLFFDTWTASRDPGRMELRDSAGRMVREIASRSTAALDEYALGEVEFLQVPARDGVLLEASMIRPPDFDSRRRYPVLVCVYGGPGSPQVRNRWGGRGALWYQLLAQKGYIILVFDNRSAGGRGVVSAWPVYRNLGGSELQDLEDCVAWLKSQSYVEGSRIGLWGWSYGGFLTAFALTHSSSFAAGIAGAPVTDWHLYDSIYTERYMGLPQDNPEGYEQSSVVKAAGQLQGRLLLVHGTIDDNVHLQNTVQLAEALQKAGKDFELMIYPGARHGVQGREQVYHLRKLLTQFLLDNL